MTSLAAATASTVPSLTSNLERHDSLQIIDEIFSETPTIPAAFCRAVQSYIPPQDRALIDLFLGRLPAWINLADRETLQLFLAKNFSPRALDDFHALSKNIYEAACRRTLGNKGWVFPMNPEPLAYAMRFAFGENVLELGAASGENGIWLAFSGTKHVYVNELCTEENDLFNQYSKAIPAEIAKKLELLPGDCLQILEKNPVLRQKIGFIVCRNLIHFFNLQQRAAFLKW
jgi:hypothetical protein